MQLDTYYDGRNVKAAMKWLQEREQKGTHYGVVITKNCNNTSVNLSRMLANMFCTIHL